MTAIIQRLSIVVLLLSGCMIAETATLQDGDIVMIRSYSYNANAIEAVTGSRFTHCGIVFRQENQWMVYEGAGRKGYLTLKEWVRFESGKNRPHWRVFRLKDASSLARTSAIENLKIAAKKLHDTPYDHGFSWDYPPGKEEYVYCSELIWKAYHEALQIDLCPLRRMASYGLTDEAMRILNSKVCKARRGGREVSLSETVVAPGDIAGSPMVMEVKISSIP